MEQATVQDSDADAVMLRMIWGVHISRAVYVAAELGIADLLADGPMSSKQLALITRTHEPSLYRVLRLLGALGVFSHDPPDHFGLTSLGGRLRSNAPAGMRQWALVLDTVGGVRPFEHILDSVMTGRPGFDRAFGTGMFEFLARNPEKATVFDAAMSERTAAIAASVADAYDFSDTNTVVDVGGGNGVLMVGLLQRHRHLQGVLFETPEVAARTRAILQNADITNRCEVIAGDFFEQVPAGADCYLLANVLHDWDDSRAVEILRNCRRSMADKGKVVIIERLIPEDASDPVPTLLSDLNMLVFTGGQERTNIQYEQLLKSAGLKLAAVQTVAFPYGVFIGLPA
jgi:hypothetical protein